MTTIKAVRIHEFGDADVLQYEDVGVSISKSEKCTLRNMWRTDLEVAKLTE